MSTYTYVPDGEDGPDVPQVGDLAYHVTRDLDPREVTRVVRLASGAYMVWLDIMGEETGPFPADQYTFEPHPDGE